MSSHPVRLTLAASDYDHVRDLTTGRVTAEGIEPNRHTLETFLRYAHEQGITPHPLTVEALFPPSVGRQYRI